MAARVDLVLEQGADFNGEIDLVDANGTPVAITGNVTVEIAPDYGSNVVIDCAVSNTNFANGVIVFTVNSIQTANLDALYPGRSVWNTTLTQDNTVIRIVEGTVRVLPDV